MKKLKIIILLGIILGSNVQIEAMFARLTTQGAKVKPPTITRVPSQVPKQDKTIPSPKKTDTSPTSSEKSNQTQDTQTSESEAPERKKSLYARSSKSTQSSDENAAPKRTIVAAIGDAIASGKQAMAAAWNNLMNSFYKTPSNAPATEGNLISRSKSDKKPSSSGGPKQSKRLYSNFPMVPESKGADVPTFGWKSLLPGSTEYTVKTLVNSMNGLVRKMQQEGVSLKNIAEYKNLRSQYEKLSPGKDYNPIAGHSSLLKDAADNILRHIRADEDGWFSQNDILKQLYNLGVRLNPEDIANLIKSTQWDERAKHIANMIDQIKNNEKLTIKKIGYMASMIVSSYQLFKSFGVDIFPYFRRQLNMDDMVWLSSEWRSIKKQTDYNVPTGGVANGQEMFANARLDNRTIAYLKSQTTEGVHQSRKVYPERSPYRDYPQGYASRAEETNPTAPLLREMRETNYVDTFLDRAQKAGFFESPNVGEETLALPTNSFDSAYNVLMEDGKYVPNEPAFRSFMLEYAPDILQPKVERGEITQEQFQYYTNKIAVLNNARDEYFRGKK